MDATIDIKNRAIIPLYESIAVAPLINS